MEVVERPRVPPERRGEGAVERHVRVRGALRESRLYGVRRLPRSVAGGFLGVLVMFLFFGGLAGWTWNFFLGFLLTVGFLGISVWALAKAPIRPAFDQRWRPKRRIDPLDVTSWRAVAEKLDARLVEGRLPRVEGAVGGIAFRLFFARDGGARTAATAILPFPVRSRFLAFPRRADFRTREDRETGDAEFDADWHVTCADPEVARRLLSPTAREWIEATEAEEVRARGRSATAWRKGYVEDEDRLYGLVMSVVSMARG